MSLALRRSSLGALLLACDPVAPPEDEVALEVADIPACEPAAEWSESWSAAEREVLARINALRAKGGRCGDLWFSPAPPLSLHPTLRCAARLHTADMIERQYLSSVDPDGRGLGDRLAGLDYAAATFAEVVAVVTEDEVDLDDDAADVVVAWQDNPTSCWQLRARELTHVGIGGAEATFKPNGAAAPQRAAYWTLTLAAPL